MARVPVLPEHKAAVLLQQCIWGLSLCGDFIRTLTVNRANEFHHVFKCRNALHRWDRLLNKMRTATCLHFGTTALSNSRDGEMKLSYTLLGIKVFWRTTELKKQWNNGILWHSCVQIFTTPCYTKCKMKNVIGQRTYRSEVNYSVRMWMHLYNTLHTYRTYFMNGREVMQYILYRSKFWGQ